MNPVLPVGRHRDELVVLSLIALGLLVILLSIIWGMFIVVDSAKLPNWAENVLVSIASVAGLKLGDCLSALVQLVTGRQVESLGSQLANTTPAAEPPPKNAAEAARHVADDANASAETIENAAEEGKE